MPKPKYTAGLHFVVSTPTQTLDKRHRKAIRSHATKAGSAARRTVQLHSWISPHHELTPLKQPVLEAPAPESEPESTSSSPSPSQVGSDFSGLQLPPGVEPYMIQDLVQLINLNKFGVYPYEICFNIHLVERGWFPYMISDLCCLHSMMFSVRAFIDGTSHHQLSRPANFHYVQTLQLLQARLNELDQTSAISDTTIMVVITLATAAELAEDFAAVTNHIEGLEKMVSLRGGVRALNTHNNIQVKVCRADLAYALLFGQPPRLLQEEISWDCFIADRGLIQCNHEPHSHKIHAFAESRLDGRLHNALRDLHAFSCISNLAYQTTRKLSPETYNEMMISILYRLTHLSFERDVLQEALRSALLLFSSTIFMQRHFMGRPYHHLLDIYDNALRRLRESTDGDLPVPVVLWLTMLSHVVSHDSSPSIWLDEAILGAGITSWSQAREILRSMVWVDFIHAELGKQVFEAALLRLDRTT